MTLCDADGDVDRGDDSRVKREAEGLTLSLLSPLSLLDISSSSDSLSDEHGDAPSTSSNFLFSIPLMAASKPHLCVCVCV